MLRCSLLLLFLFLSPFPTRAEPEYGRDILPLLERWCFECHDAASEKGGVNLERYRDHAAVMRERRIWGEVFNKVEAREMPPPRRPDQPSEAERKLLLQWIAGIAAAPDPTLGVPDPGRPPLRRLTRLEYNNTVRDLLGLPFDLFIFPERLPFSDKSYYQPASGRMGDTVEVKMREYGQKYPVLLPGAGLPGDNRAEHGFTNRGDANNLSPLLLEKLVAFAGELVRHPQLPEYSPVFARLLGLDPAGLPRTIGKPVTGEIERAPGVHLVPALAPELTVWRKSPASPDWPQDFRNQVAEAHASGRGGVLDIPKELGNATIAGKGGLIKATFGQRVLTVNPDADLWLPGFATARAVSGNLLLTNKVKGGKVFELTFDVRGEDEDEGVVRLGVFVLGRKGQRGEVTLTARFSDATESVNSASLEPGPEGTTFFSFAAHPGETIQKLRVDGSAFSGEYVLLDDLAFITNGRPQIARKPEAPADGTPVAELLEKSAGPVVAPPVHQRLADFMTRVFRRPASVEEIEGYLSLYEQSRAGGKSEADAMRDTVQALLSSPGFLYLSEPVVPGGGAVRSLDGFELASRLAYFIWASSPDEELLRLAGEGRLREESVLEAQTRRLLRDPRSRELGESFAVQWLRLDQLYTSKPDRELFPDFYQGPQGKSTLHSSQLREALLLFETVLVEDRSILDFINADYTWLNGALAKAYHLSELTSDGKPVSEVQASGTRELKTTKHDGDRWTRVTLADRTRGGYLTMGAPLTVTSLPFRTSPVKRGAWLLETIFHRPPTEPKVAFSVSNDTKEAALQMSIRQRFEAHRDKPACFSCHVRLDPPGFALERFDAVGRLREKDGDQPVDTRGEWNGVAFDGPAEYKALLAREPRAFVRGFTEHLLSYALGRKLELYDLPTVTSLCDHVEAEGCRLSALITGIVKSGPFRQVRNE